MSIIYGRSCAGGFCSAKLSVLSAAPPDAEYYVAAYGDDVTGDGSQANPWASLAKTSVVINSSGQYKNYVVYVMTDLTSTASARYYDNNVTITSLGGNRFTVTRGSGFAALSDVMRGGYNPPMLEIETVDLTPTATPISLTLENIIFDDAYLHEGTIFGYAPTDNGVSCTGTTYVQDSIVTSYALCTTIILGDGAALHSFGGMTAARASDGATLIMQSGSLISDIGSTNTTRSLSSTTTDYRAVGETAVSISSGSHFYMYYGAKIADIANAHSVKLSGVYKCFIDGEISGMKGNKGWDATDHSTSATHEGRGFKSAVFFSGGTTLDPNTGEPGSAIIGPNANIHHNAVKCGAIGVSRSTNISIKVFGKINDNAGQTGTNWQTVFGIPVALAYGTNGGGIYVVAGGTVILEDGSEVCRNSVMNIAYGGGINIQQAGSKLIMNGGLVQDSTTADGMGPGIAVNKSGDCFFEMNGGVVDNGPNGVLLFNNRAVIATAVREDSDCNGRHILNEGNVSDVTINSLVAYGTNTANQYRNLYISENVLVQTGYVAIAGNMQSATSTTNIPRQVTLLPAGAFGDISIGNPNRALYPTIGTALPEGWTMPTSANNVIAFWMKKAGTAEFSVPAPTSGSGGANYNTNLRYFAAVMELTAAGGAVSGAPVKLYQTKIENGQIIISAPLDAYPNGAIVALVQPTTAYGEIYFEGLPVLYSSIFATDYTLPYTALYNMPSCLHADLKTDLHDNTNTDFIFTIYPDFRTIPDISSLTLTSEIFELSNAVWDSGSGTLSITLSLKTGWEDASDLESLFGFDCGMDADDFEDGEFLRLTRLLSITSTSLSKNYLICGNDAETEMITPKGDIRVSKVLSGNATDSTKDFHFQVTFSDGGTYDGIASGDVVTLKGGENILISGIPHEIGYSIVELEANQNGYITTSTGISGTISTTLSEVVFTNSRSSYIVTYDANDGTGTMPPDTVVYGDNFTLAANEFSMTEYRFVGWNTAADGSGTNYADLYAFTPWEFVSDLNLYAQWAPNSYTLTYDANGGTGTMRPDIVTYSVNFTLPANTFTRTGYTFSHWNTRADGTGTSWLNEWEFSPWEYPSDMTFYAQWIPDNTYSVTYNGNANIIGAAPVDANSPYPAGSTVTVLGQGDMANPGYTFLGWSTSATATSATYTAGATFTINANTMLYAVWQAIPTYTVTYNGNGNTSGTAPVDANNPYLAGSTVTVLGQGNLARTGYSFLGWATSATYTAGSTFTINSNVTLYAVWRIIPPTLYTVTVEDSAASPNGSGSYEAGVTVTINAGSKAGYIFIGWTVVSGGVSVANSATADFTMPARDVVVRANWEEIPTQPTKFRVDVENSYADENGSGTYDVDATVTINAGTRDDGYVFVGWTVVSGGVTLTDSRSPSTTFVMPASNVVVQANWSLDPNIGPGGDTSSGKWALVNLILCCVGAVAALFTLLRAFIQKNKKTKMLWLVLAIVAGIAGVVVFLLTENMRNPMTFVDWWTLVNAIILILGCVGAALAIRKENREKNQQAYKRA